VGDSLAHVCEVLLDFFKVILHALERLERIGQLLGFFNSRRAKRLSAFGDTRAGGVEAEVIS